MKKITFRKLFILFLLNGLLCNSQTENLTVDLEEYFQQDPASPNTAPVLVKINYIDFFYNNGGTKYSNAISYSRTFGETEWTESFQIVNSYDGNNKLTTSETQTPDGMGGYMPSSKRDYIYNTDGLQNIITTSIYTGVWTNWSQDIYSYNVDNTVSQIKNVQWNVVMNSYEDNSLFTYSYTNGLNTLINRYTYSGMTPIDDYRITITYTPFDMIDTMLKENYNGSSWENGTYTVYQNFAEILLSNIQYSWDLNLTPPDWRENLKTIYTDTNTDGFPEVITGQGWDRDEANGGANPFWYDNYKLVYQYSNSLDVDERALVDGKVYPNPFKNELTISLPTSISTVGELTIFDSIGKNIATTYLKQGTKSISLNNPYLANGIYFIKISTEDEDQTFKVIKE